MSDWTDAALDLLADSAWDLGQSSGATYADLGAAAKDLTLTGSGYTQGVSTGLTGAPNAFDAGGTSAYLLRASALTQVVTDKFTWVGLFYDNADPCDDTCPWFCASYTGGHTDPFYSFALFKISGPFYRLVIATGGGFSPINTSTVIIGTGAWHQIALRYDGANVYLNVDGVDIFSTAKTGNVEDMGSFAIGDIPALGAGFTPDIRAAGGAYWSDVAVAESDLADLWEVAQNGPPCSPPVNVGGSGLPEVTGGPFVGDVLTVTDGTWTGDPTITFTYQWYRVCGTVEELLTGETASTYTLVDDDIGCNVFCEVTGSSSCPPDGTADSNEIGPVEDDSPPTNVVAPTISGSPFVGHTLILSDPGTWTGDPTFTYQWQIDCGSGFVDIVGETTTSLELTEEMIGCDIRCVVTGTNDFGSADANSNEMMVEANVPAATRFCQGPMWRFIVTDLDCQTLTFLDRIATSRTAVYTLNAPAVSTGVLPSDAPEVNIAHTDGDPFVAEGNRMLFGFRQEVVSDELTWVVRYGGLILQIEDIADSDNANTHYTAFDPLKLLFARPVQTIDGDPVGTDGLSFTQTRVDVIIGTLLLNTIVNNGTTHIDAGASYGGTGFYTGTIESLPQIDINFQQGMSVGDAIKILTDQNYCDVLLTPIWDPENRPGYVCELSILAQAGAVQDNAIFAWDKPSRSLVGISRLLEGTARANNVRYFAGQGGNAGSSTVDDAASVLKYGEYWSQQFWPGQKIVAAVAALAEAALDMQKNGKETVTISPIPGCTPLPFQEYFLGDRVPVYASTRFRQEIPQDPVGTAAPSTQYQRIYGMPIDIEDDSTEMIKQMLTSVQA